jgi:hypothetical protein
MRDHASTITKAISARRARPISRWPKCPVHLGLFAGQRREPQVRFGLRSRPVQGNQMTSVQPARSQRRNRSGPGRSGCRRQSRLPQRSGHPVAQRVPRIRSGRYRSAKAGWRAARLCALEQPAQDAVSRSADPASARRPLRQRAGDAALLARPLAVQDRAQGPGLALGLAGVPRAPGSESTGPTRATDPPAFPIRPRDWPADRSSLLRCRHCGTLQ